MYDSDRQASRPGTDSGADHIRSYYAASAGPIPERGRLDADIETDVCVVGGGYTGLSAALHLAERGYRVVVLEANKAGWGASGRNGGHVGIGQRKNQQALEEELGSDKARVLWQYGLDALELVRSTIERHRIDCDLKTGILHLAAKPSHVEYLREEAERLSVRYGYQPIRFVDRDEARQMVGSERYFAGLLDTGSMHFQPLKYALGLAAAAEAAGARIFEASRVIEFTKAAAPVARTRGGSVRSKYLILACNAYLEKLEPRIAGYIMPINNFMLATEPLDERLARELVRDDVAVQDTLFVINYWKLSADNRLLFGGGETYSRRFPDDIGRFVRKYMLRVYPQLEATRIDYAWGGSLAITLNRMPRFGRLGGQVFYAHGYSGHGITIGTLAGQLLAEVVSGTAERFDVMASLPAKRFPGGTLLRWPGLVLGMLYYSLKDKL